MESYPLFHVIDAKKTYNMLLRRSWVHQNGMTSSTLHQCFKYCRNGNVKTIVADVKPFTSTEAHFVDSKFYVEGTFIEEVMTTPMKELKQKGKNFSHFTNEDKISQGLKNLTLPLTNLEESTILKPLLKGYVRLVEQSLFEHQDLLSYQARGFDPNTYRLLVKAGYKQEDVVKLTEEPSNAKS